MTQESELTVVTAEIVDILPREYQTPEMQQWVKDSLAQGNSVSEMLEYCKTQFGIVVSKIEACESRIERQGFRLDAHIKYTDEKFAAVSNEISALKQQIAVTEAVNNERANMNQFMLKGVMDSQNATNQSVVKAAKSNSGYDHNSPFTWFGLVFGVIAISIAVGLLQQASKPNQPAAKQCGIDVECDVRPLKQSSPINKNGSGI